MGFLPDSIVLHAAVLIASFFVITKSADFLVDGAVSIAYRLKIPKIVIGIVLVGFATTAPEFTVSVIASARGEPQFALGNAIGSVIVDDAVALALAIVVAPVAISVDSRVLRRAGFFLIVADVVAFLLSINGVLARWEGAILIAILVAYLSVVVVQEKKRRLNAEAAETDQTLAEHLKGTPSGQLLRFLGGVAGVVLASEFLLDSAKFIAYYLGAPKTVIGLTIIAIGTSLPEIMTCILASRKGHGDLAVGDILGADILNILWIIGTAAVVNPIRVHTTIIMFSYPSMIVIVATMLLFMRMGYRLERWKGFVLFGLYAVFLALAFFLLLVKGTRILPAG